MDSLIKSVAEQLSLDEAVVRRGIGQVFKYCEQQVPPEHREWFAKVPGAESLARQEQANEQQAQGVPRTDDDQQQRQQPKTLIGFVIRFVLWLLTARFILDWIRALLSPFLGEQETSRWLNSVRDGANLVNRLQGLGITTDKVAPLCQKVVAYMREHLGDDVVDDLLADIPALGSLMDSAKKDE